MDPITRSIVIIGTGFAGIAMAIRLKQAGLTDFTVLEQAPGVGGTWRDNHYPGAACDVPSHLYSLSFEPNPDWTRAFAPQREILQYLERCVDRYDLRPHIRFDSTVSKAVFDEPSGTWRLSLREGPTFVAKVVVAGCGGLSRPSLPDIPGLSTFEGDTFHSARWNHEVSLAGKDVAVIGTGASAIQIVPAVAEHVRRLYVYQRTPPWILPKADRDITPLEQAVFRRVPWVQRLARAAIYARLEARALGLVVEPKLVKGAEEEAKEHLAASIEDPVLRDKLTPRYTLGCKRVLLSNDYYPALARSNVELVTDGIARVEADGIVTKDGTKRRLDAIVLATGFHAAEAAAPFPILGRGGRSLEKEWEDGAEAYLGTTVHGFPNLFLIVGPNTGLGHNSMVFMIESQVRYVLDAIRYMKQHHVRFVDVKAAAQRAYNTRLQARFPGTVWTSGCTSWYHTRSGKNTTLWPGFTLEFRYRTRRFDPAPYERVTAGPPAVRERAAARAGGEASFAPSNP